jgi:hypothetical protein
MWQRCSNPKSKAFKDYGARGITVCGRWAKFSNFIADMGTRPKGLTLERKKNGVGYNPSNCVWATRQEQSNNTRSNHLITVRRETLTMSQWGRRVGLKPNTIHSRLMRGWTPEEAVSAS